MQQGGVVQRTARMPQDVPLLVRFLAKLVLDVLPAALASVIGGLLFAHYQFGHAAMPTPAAEPAAPASAEMVQLVRDEHAMIRDFLLAQRTAEKTRRAAADAEDARAAADARLTAAALAEAKPAAPPGRAILAAATTAPAVAATPSAPLVISRVEPNESAVGAAPDAPVAAAAAAPPPPDHPSLVASTLAIPGHVVAATLHAVSVIGGIPSWIGNRLGGTPS